jgi:hypothetical protein
MKPLLRNLGAKLLLMAAEDWRGEEERNTLGMAGYWLEKLGEDAALASESQREAAGTADEKPDGQAENETSAGTAPEGEAGQHSKQ